MNQAVNSLSSSKNLIPSKQSKTEFIKKPVNHEDMNISMSSYSEVSIPKQLDNQVPLKMMTDNAEVEANSSPISNEDLENNDHMMVNNISKGKPSRKTILQDFETNRFSRRFLTTLTQIHQSDECKCIVA